MPTIQGTASLTPAMVSSPSVTARSLLAASFSSEALFSSIPESLFDLLQNLLDAEQWDPAARVEALSALVAYHAATISDDKSTAVRAINKVSKDALLLLGHVWGFYSSGVFGVYGMPVDRPAAGQLAEIVAQITTTRATRGRTTLKVTS